MNGVLVRHKGIDFPYLTGTHVYAVANGTVVDIASNYQNGERASLWGNFVLIRHDQRHYDRTTGQWAYVYSMYLHLSQWSVRVAETAHVNAGDWIADSDDTGSGSGGQHFHLQIVVNSQPDRTLEPSTLESETRSRNPELWLNPYNGNTGTVVGKVTNTSGEAVGNRLVCGLQKDEDWEYESNLTYVDARFNPDDILYENWGTTDVTPGTYAIHTCPNTTDLCDCSNPLPMGMHTVQAGRVTYVGLFPVWLPYVLGNYNGWNSAIVVRNNSDTYQAQVNTTYFNLDGTVWQQTQTYIPTRASATLTPPSGFAGSALVVSSEDIGVVVENRKSGWYAYAYTGQSAPNTIGYLPQILQYLATVWHTNIQAMNTGVQPTTITINFYRQNGTPAPNGTTTLANVAVNGSGDVEQYMSNGDTLYVGRTSAAQPVAGVVRISDNSNYRRLGYSSIPVADTKVWLPFVMTRLGNDWGAALWIQNTTGTGTTATARFYQNGGQSGIGTVQLPANGLATINLRTDYAQYGLPAGWYGSAQVTASVPIAVVVNQLNDGAYLGASYEGIPNSAGSTTVFLPRVVRKELTGQCYYSNFTVRNLGSTAANLTIQYYDETGTLRATVNDTGISSEKIYNLYSSPPAGLPQNFRGSAMIISTNGQPLVATSNLLYYYSAPTCTSRDDTISYTGVNR